MPTPMPLAVPLAGADTTTVSGSPLHRLKLSGVEIHTESEPLLANAAERFGPTVLEMIDDGLLRGHPLEEMLGMLPPEYAEAAGLEKAWRRWLLEQK